MYFIKTLSASNFKSRSVIFKHDVLVSCGYQDHVIWKSRKLKLHKTSCRSYTSTSSNRVAFLGSDSFAVPSLIALTKCFGPDSVTVVVSNENNTIGKFAQKYSLKTVLWNEFKTEASSGGDNNVNNMNSNFYLGVVASFGYLIPENVINRFSKGIFNVHPSLLPKYRGAAPINRAIINGDEITGVSIMQIAAHRFDVGPVLHTETVPIHPHVRGPDLNKIMSEIGASALSEVLNKLDHYMKNPIPQDNDKASLAKKLTPDLALVNWNTQNAHEIYNLFRGLSGFYKLTTSYEGKNVDLDVLGILQVGSIKDNNYNQIEEKCKPELSTDFSTFYNFPVMWNVNSLPENVLPGHVIFKHDVLCIKCGGIAKENSSEWVFARKVKVGVKWMTPKDFENGFLRKGRKRGSFRFETATKSDQTVPLVKQLRAFTPQ